MRRNATKARRGQAQLKAKSSPWPTAKQTNYLSNERGLVCKLKKQSHTHTYLHIPTYIHPHIHTQSFANGNSNASS